MKNRKFLKKLFAVLLLGIGAATMCACQTADHTAKIDPSQTTMKFVYVEEGGKPVRYCEVYNLVYANPTIYAVKQFHYIVTGYSLPDWGGQIVGVVDDYENVYIPNGCALITSFRFKVENDSVQSFKLENCEASIYASVWDTYLGWWIATIVLLAIGLIAHLCRIFSSSNPEEIKGTFRDTIAMQLVVLALIAIICIVPLIFSSWVVTCILAGGYLSFLVVAGLTTLIRVKALG